MITDFTADPAKVVIGSVTLGAAPAAMVASPAICCRVLIINPTGNDAILIGNSTGQNRPLAAGSEVYVHWRDAGKIHLSGTEGDVVQYWIEKA